MLTSSTKFFTEKNIKMVQNYMNLEENHEEGGDEVVNPLDIARGRMPAHHSPYTRMFNIL